MANDWLFCSERLGFRRWAAEDLELARGLWGDPRVTALIDARGALTDEAVERRLAAEIASEESHGVQYWPMFERSSGVHVGCSGLHVREPANARVYELGFHLRATEWGKGYASEAARAVVARAFDVIGATSLFAGHNPKNDASRRLLLELGFVYTHDEPFAATGLDHPSYSLGRGATSGSTNLARASTPSKRSRE
jgi:RimJ/RimL family protein N-acetyltransferase